MSEGMPNEGSVYAREGSAAHEIGERALKENRDAHYYIGVTVPDYPEIIVDEHMCTAVQEYLDAVRGEIEKYEAEGHTDWDLGIEVGFDLGQIYPGMFGTCDAVLFFPAWKKLIVFDYKHGWVSVPVEKNKQTMYYGLGAITTRYHNYEIEHLELVIVQPRSGRTTVVKRWSCDMEELLDFKYVLIDSAKRTEHANAPLCPGEWCKFCLAAPVCRALLNRIEEIVMVAKNSADPVNPDKIPFDQLKPIWDNIPMIEGWAKNFKSYVRDLAIKENRLMPGTKLVEGPSHRKWVDAAKAKKELEALQAIGEIEGAIEIIELKSPAQIEDMLPKKLHGVIRNLWKKGRGNLTLAAITDERGSAKADALKEFL